MYNAHGTFQNDYSNGSTRLHLDVTSAINIMLYAANLPDGTPGNALWHIFPAHAAVMLREFIRNDPDIGFTGHGDPIHNQGVYLTPSLLDRFADKYGLSPHTIRQSPGVAVFIPAGCPHQVACLFHTSIQLLFPRRDRSAINLTQSRSHAISFASRAFLQVVSWWKSSVLNDWRRNGLKTSYNLTSPSGTLGIPCNTFRAPFHPHLPGSHKHTSPHPSVSLPAPCTPLARAPPTQRTDRYPPHSPIHPPSHALPESRI